VEQENPELSYGTEIATKQRGDCNDERGLSMCYAGRKIDIRQKDNVVAPI
jgi:hypothetical protein